MRSFTSFLISLSCLTGVSSLHAEVTQNKLFTSNTDEAGSKPIPPAETIDKAIEPFTGKISKNKVRLRLQPTFEGQPLRELDKGKLVVVTGETDDFYAVRPIADTKAYIFRTYVLDNIIEGSRVNVRLKADLDAPVIAQLNSGDRVDGRVYAENNKWFEIAVPTSTRFYVSKDYVEKVGDAGYMERTEKRQEEVVRLLNMTKAVNDAELQKPYDKINADGIVANYQRIIFDFKDFPETGAKAQEYLSQLQDNLSKKKIAFLEQQTQKSSQILEQKNKQLADELNAHKSKLIKLERQIQSEKSLSQIAEVSDIKRAPSQPPQTMTNWVPFENALFATWSQETGNDNPKDFYRQQKEKAFVIKGIVDPYNRLVKNKPGNYMLLNATSKLPIAFLYSTHVNLNDYVGHEISVTVSPRPNNNYAFPAYFVLSVD
jgi:hypothetical protein